MTYYIPEPYKPTPLEVLLARNDRFRWGFLKRVQNGGLFTPQELSDLGGKSIAATLLAPDLKSFDTALDQGWLNYWHDSEYEYVRLGTVWAYPDSSIWGLPFPVSQEARRLIHERERKENRAS